MLSEHFAVGGWAENVAICRHRLLRYWQCPDGTWGGTPMNEGNAWWWVMVILGDKVLEKGVDTGRVRSDACHVRNTVGVICTSGIFYLESCTLLG